MSMDDDAPGRVRVVPSYLQSDEGSPAFAAFVVGVILGMVFILWATNGMEQDSRSLAASVACQQSGYRTGDYSEATKWKVVCYDGLVQELKPLTR